MSKKKAGADVVELIRRLATTPDQVLIYRTAKYDFMGSGITKDDVCDAVCDWIDSGKDLSETSIHTIPELKGTLAYELKPRLSGKVYYVKLTLERNGGDWLLILLTHLDA